MSDDLHGKPALMMLGELNAKVDILLGREDTNSDRISKLEKWQWTSASIAAVFAFLTPIILRMEPLAKLFQ